MWMRRLAVLNQVIVVLGSVTQLLAGMRSEPPTKRRIAESLLSWSLPLNLGVLETFFFVRHVIRKRAGAEGSGEVGEDRVRSEVAVAHLHSACSASSLSGFAACSGSLPLSARRSSSSASQL